MQIKKKKLFNRKIPEYFPMPEPAHSPGKGLYSNLHKLLVFSFFYVLYQVFPDS
jgi:hypothetical protein